jgi:hypothetical protein
MQRCFTLLSVCRLELMTSIVYVLPAKNGVYLTLVAEVRAQLGLDEVVRVDCQGMHATDYKKIGAKLKVCVSPVALQQSSLHCLRDLLPFLLLHLAGSSRTTSFHA